MSRAATSLLSSRSRFFDKVEWSQTGSSTSEPDEPAEQEVEVEPLHQLAFRTDRIERLQQERAAQLLGRHAGPADAAVERSKSPDKAVKPWFTIVRIERSGCPSGTRSSSRST
jgi:hypothetical protein